SRLIIENTPNELTQQQHPLPASMGNTSSANTRPQVPNHWDATQISSQKGKVAIVTGANSGIGYETALQLARHGAHVVLACRNEARGQQAEANIREILASTSDAGTVEFKQVDVSDLSSVQSFSEEFMKTHHRLDLLVNNAGVMAVPYSKTVDGYERQFATNHLGHFALTAQLFSLLKQSASSRVVNTSSYVHRGITATNLVKVPATENNWLLRMTWRALSVSFMYQDAPAGALPTLDAATGPAPVVEGGDYFGPGNLIGTWRSPKRVQPRSTAYDTAAAHESERLAKFKFDVQ
ncbi:hypothetical protein BBJ28_00026174, partial [Nothophytophthora sp. Chile5]